MQKAELQRSHVQNQPAQRQGGDAALDSPQGEQIAQLEAMAESSPQAGKQAQLATVIDSSPALAAQRKLIGQVDNCPAQAAQRQAINSIAQRAETPAKPGAPIQFSGREGDEWGQGPGQGESAPPTPRPVQGGQMPPPLPEAESLRQDGYSPRAGEERDETAQLVKAGESSQLKVAQCAVAPVKPNNTGLPDDLKSGIESLSGMAMNNVKVHYNSSQPAQLNALAYAQGTDIHVAPGQEKHLPHEAWHVVQQAKGRVKPTMQMKCEAASIKPNTNNMVAQCRVLQRAFRDAGNLDGVARGERRPVQLVGDPTAIGLNKYAATNNGVKKTAEMRTNGVLAGSSPQVDPPGYDYIRAQGLTNYWIRFHLINEEAGGLGQAWNLVPGSKIDNGQYHSDHEKSLKKTVDAAFDDSTNRKEVYFGVELQFLPVPAPSLTMTDAATPFFPTTMKVWHSTTKDSGTTWNNLKSGADFTFSGKDGHKVPPDTTGALSLGNPGHQGGITSILSRGGVVDAGDMYQWLATHWDIGWAGADPQQIEADLGSKQFSDYRTLEEVANGSDEGEGLTNLSRMIALGKITQ